MSKIVDFLKGVTPSNIAGEAIKNTIAGVGDLADRFIQSPDERAAFRLELEKIATERIAAENANTDSARDMNAKVQDSANASWLSKNVAYMLDIFVVVMFSLMLVMIYNKVIPESNKEIFYSAFGALTALVTTVFNFHRGSSKSSQEKQEQLNKISKQ